MSSFFLHQELANGTNFKGKVSVSVGQMGVQKSQTSQTTTNSLWLALLAAALHPPLLSDPHMCVPTFCHKRKACDQWTFY